MAPAGLHEQTPSIWAVLNYIWPQLIYGGILLVLYRLIVRKQGDEQEPKGERPRLRVDDLHNLSSLDNEEDEESEDDEEDDHNGKALTVHEKVQASNSSPTSRVRQRKTAHKPTPGQQAASQPQTSSETAGLPNPLELTLDEEELERATWAEMHNAMLGKFIEKKPDAAPYLRKWKDPKDKEKEFDDEMKAILDEYETIAAEDAIEDEEEGQE